MQRSHVVVVVVVVVVAAADGVHSVEYQDRNYWPAVSSRLVATAF